jgi:5-(carboxyamino)imidazole ribonucleotide mutase
MTKPKVALIMGSDSDYPVLKSCISILNGFGIDVEVRVMSAHRTPLEAADLAKNAKGNGIEVIIAAAGKAAHLPGVLAAYTTLPVIGIPIKASCMEGLDALLSIVQMPKGVPVATVAIDGGDNAAILAAQILGIKYPEIAAKLDAFKEEMAAGVRKSDAALTEKIKNSRED